MYLWSFVIAAALGAICALQLRAVFYSLIVFVVVCAFCVLRYILGDHILDILISAVLYECAFALGFVASVVGRYFRTTSGKTSQQHGEDAEEAGLIVTKSPKRGNGDPL